MAHVPGLEDAEYAVLAVQAEVPDAFRRAVEAGAKPPLTYVGAGAFGIVFCDTQDHAWKVGRLPSDTAQARKFLLESFADEYEWMRDAAKTDLSKNVAKVYVFHPEEIVLERECVRGHPGGWADDKKLWALHKAIEKAMIPFGWVGPEFKENSYIIKADGSAVLVDTSMVMRIGANLSGWVDDILRGNRSTWHTWNDLAFCLLRERSWKTIPEEVLLQLVDRLAVKDPEILERFSIRGRS